MSFVDMQHQYWVTKQTVLRRLGGKEDECVVASDAELDAKLELFRSVSESCVQLQRVIDTYQERICILAQEENALGRFLKDAGKNNGGVGKHMTVAGKALSYSSQQRIQLRSPLLRLHHEVDTFRARAVGDTRGTLTAMERSRTEYRAALSWMKAASGQLDPDTGRGVEKFRKAQGQVRLSKTRFDRLTLDCLQKVDLLAAARCNMFSHALVQYQSSLLSFHSRTCQTLLASAHTLRSAPQYDFCILKELAPQPVNESSDLETNEIVPADNDQLLFFQDEYTDEKPDDESQKTTKKSSEPKASPEPSLTDDLLGLSKDLLALNKSTDPTLEEGFDSDLLGLTFGNESGSFMPSQLMQDFQSLDLNVSSNSFDQQPASSNVMSDLLSPSALLSSPLDLSNGGNTTPCTSDLPQNGNQKNTKAQKKPSTKQDINRKDMSAWFQLFSELDPLANPDSMMGNNVSNSHSA